MVRYLRAEACRTAILALILTCAPRASAELVDDYGAKGDGITWDHKAIQAAINAAGPGGLVDFSPGRTYVQCARLLPLAGQTIRGNGATLKRCDEIVAVLTEDAAAGATLLTVDDPSVFELGQSLTPVMGTGSIADGEYSLDHWAQSVADKTITISLGLRQSYPAGSLVTVKFAQVESHYPDVTIEHLTFDGNRANNEAYRAWTDNQALISRSGMRVTNSRFVELPGNGITAYGTNLLIDDNFFSGLDGPIVHLSGNNPTNGSTVTISRNYVESVNRQWIEMDHSEGVVTISKDNYSIVVIGNTVRDAPVPFISRFHSYMQDWYVADNHVTGTRGILEAKSFVGSTLRNVVFERNTFIDVGHSRTYTQANADPITGFVFRENRVLGGSLQLTALAESTIVDNSIKACERTPLEVPEGVRVITEPNELMDDYCLLSASVTPYPPTIEAPGGAILYRVDVFNTEDTDAASDVEVLEIAEDRDVPQGEDCDLALPHPISPQQTISCWLRREISGSTGDLIENTITVKARTAGGTAVALTANAAVSIVDTLPPVIELKGQNPLELEVGQPYYEPGVSAMDASDGDLTETVVIDSSAVDMSAAGIYQVTYTVADAGGNWTTLTREVVVSNAPFGGGGATDLAMILIGAIAARLRRRIALAKRDSIAWV